MAYVVPTNVATGDVLTAATWNQAVVENSRKLRGDYARAELTSGNITLNSTNWADVTSSADLVLAAETDDVIEVCVNALTDNAAVIAVFDVVTRVSGAAVNCFSTQGAALTSNSGDGLAGWLSNGSVYGQIQGSVFRKLVAGDISSNTVTLRLRYRTFTANNRVFNANSTTRFQWWARNHGPVEV